MKAEIKGNIEYRTEVVPIGVGAGSGGESPSEIGSQAAGMG